MHRTLLVLLLLVVIAPSAMGQLRLPKDSLDWPTPHNVVAFNPAGIAVDYLSIHYVRALDERNAIGAYGALIYRPVGAYLPRGFAGGLLYRYYPAAQALWRFHYGAQLSWHDAWLTANRDVRASGLGVGLSVGWQWLPVRGFAVGFAFGQQYISSFEAIENEALEQVFGFRSILSFDLGVAW